MPTALRGHVSPDNFIATHAHSGQWAWHPYSPFIAMLNVATIAQYLEGFAPTRLAEEWDNVGLLIGSSNQPVSRIMTCLTLTADSAQEAVREKAELVVTHHPLPFRPIRRLTDDTAEGRLLLELTAARIAVYSPHTAFDSAGRGINQRLAEGLDLLDIAPLAADAQDPAIGSGRFGQLDPPVPLAELARRAAEFLNIDGLHLVGEQERPIRRVAVGCGSAGELLTTAVRCGCDCFLTGETRFHTCLEAEAANVALVLVGHFASERFAVEQLAELLAVQFPTIKIWASRAERDPLAWFTPICPTP
jgi:dinuclear metal center YbgI/SA1388 family protein